MSNIQIFLSIKRDQIYKDAENRPKPDSTRPAYFEIFTKESSNELWREVSTWWKEFMKERDYWYLIKQYPMGEWFATCPEILVVWVSIFSTIPADLLKVDKLIADRDHQKQMELQQMATQKQMELQKQLFQFSPFGQIMPIITLGVSLIHLTTFDLKNCFSYPWLYLR